VLSFVVETALCFAMMLSTYPMAVSRDELQKPVTCTGCPASGKVEKRTVKHDCCLVPQADDSTDVGSSSSDVDMSQSSLISASCTDSELQDASDGVDVKHWSQTLRFKFGNKASQSKGMVSEPIMDAAFVHRDHGAVLFTPAPRPMANGRNQEPVDSMTLASIAAPPGWHVLNLEARKPRALMPMLATESFSASTCTAQPNCRADSFRAPPGLPSPMRRRKSKNRS
jgi:hypothetical protein